MVDKHNSAVAKGAAGLIVISAAPDRGSSANLFGPGYYNQLKVPVAVVGASGAAALARTNAPIRLVLDTENIQIKSRNVLAQTKTGTPDEVVMVARAWTARREVRGSTPRVPGWPLCWKRRCSWVRCRR